MSGWPDTRLTELFAITHPIIQAPMAGASTPEMAMAVGEAGGLGSLACAMLSVDETRAALAKLSGPINVNFFCHTPPRPEAAVLSGWVDRLQPYYDELGLAPDDVKPGVGRAPFDDAYCTVIEDLRPRVVSFHFGLPEQALLDRVRPRVRSSRRQPPSRKHAGSSTVAATRSSRWARKPEATAAISSRAT